MIDVGKHSWEGSHCPRHPRGEHPKKTSAVPDNTRREAKVRQGMGIKGRKQIDHASSPSEVVPVTLLP